ncbi:WAP four-disulfide core domain protein 18-like isoform X1 [Mus caroli]|uniref:WAP four-disulfide core domain protein 18-like isoform X1 n=1 Tax=Mus caroli TaxID=10089 RepID=A0A6P5QJY9_MUSCR|nr:WAP four-disulfide core domain protein 18-like isoform X1 [Mus caroli]
MKTATVLFLEALIAVGMNTTYAVSSPKIKCVKEFEKPGACPKHSPESVGICVDQCSGDRSCPGKMKCCSNSCGHVCKPPVF